jgi:formate-dependent nitrite reductase membrane component NrfD
VRGGPPVTGEAGRRGRRAGRKGGGEKPVVPVADFRSYYGRPVVKETVWGPDIPSYLFLGGLAGASSVLGAGADLTGHSELSRAAKCAAAGAISLSMVALVHDLGRPLRFINMLRVIKVTSPMSVGTWILSGYTPLALTAAACAVTRKFRWAGLAATLGAAALGPAVAAYTSVLICDTATPAWHGGYREMPFLFAGSAATAAGGFGMLAVRPEHARQAVSLAVLGGVGELTAKRLLMRRLGAEAEPYESGRAGKLMRGAEGLLWAGLAGTVLGSTVLGSTVLGSTVLGGTGLSRRSGVAARIAGATLLAASALTRFGVFEAGRASARDPKYTVGPQRERAEARASAAPAHHQAATQP